MLKRFVDLSPVAINPLVYDFDCVMTDNLLPSFQDGTKVIFTNRSDVIAINRMNE
jgi:hypothetical protein